jgi:putative aldouronate transport system substrate-binding protein
MTASTVVACSSNGVGSTSTTSSTESGKAPGKEAPKKIKLVISNSGGWKFPQGTDENNNPYIKYVREKTNLNVEIIAPPGEGYAEKVNAIMSSGDLPDLIKLNSQLFTRYLGQKAFQPLNELLDKYGQELKKHIPEDAWKNVTFDGKIYAVPTLSETPGNVLMYARKDWLDKLGLKEPKTLDEFTKVMEAFATKDPDGNGKQDTMGTTIAGYTGSNGGSRTDPFFGAFGVQPSIWMEKNGKLVYSSTLPEVKEALTYLSGLFKDKWLDQEWALNKEKNIWEKISSGKIGIYPALWHETRSAMLTSKQNDPNANWIPLQLPTGKNGESSTGASALVGGYNAIPVNSKNAESVIKMLNFIIGEGHRDLYLGFENDIWTMKDGKVVTNFDEHNKHVYRLMLAQMVIPMNSPVVRSRLDSLGMEFRLNENIGIIEKHLIPNKYLGLSTPSMDKHGANLKKLEEESFTKFIMGVLPMSDFDKFVEQWNREGGSEITKEVNDWYVKSKK